MGRRWRWDGHPILEPNPFDGPWVPTICLAASKWFPEPWLSIPDVDRKQVVARFAPVYESVRPLIISEGRESATQARMRDKVMSADNEKRGRCFRRYTMLLDWSEPTTRIKQRFASWLTAHEPQGVRKQSHRGHHRPVEWLWALTYHRLVKLPKAKRQRLEGKLGIEVSDYQLFRGTKRIMREMKRRHYTE
jgi:hypothetical protein